MNRMNVRKSLSMMAVVFIALAMLVPLASITATAAPAPLPWIDPKTIPQFVNQLNGPPPVYVPTSTYVDGAGKTIQRYDVNMVSFNQRILPASMGLMTPVWGYEGLAKDSVTGAPLGLVHNSPAPSFEATRGVGIEVRYTNQITMDHMFAVDPTLHWANPNGMPSGMDLMAEYANTAFPVYPFGFDGAVTPTNPNGYDAQGNVPLVPHLHGGEVQSTSDGHPEAWWTAVGTRGMEYSSINPADYGTNAATFYYPNEQPAGTLWYHDHALGITRINVMSGLAGFYLLRDPGTDAVAPLLPSGKYEIPLAIQDRTFKPDGSFYFDTVGLNPTIHPYWMPEFFGNTIMVNGQVWPNMNVDAGQYRLRLLDGSNARFYTVQFKVPALGIKLPFTVIGSDDAYLKSPVVVNELTMAPGERYDVLVDFSALPTGTKVIMTNSAKAPFPSGAKPDPQTTGKIMQFTVGATPGFAAQVLPANLNPTLAGAFPSLGTPSKTRTLTLVEMMGALGPTMILLNGQEWMAPVSELPLFGTTEDWVIVNPTADTHPIHLHLVQFQLVSRQAMDTVAYDAAWMMLNGGMPPYTGTVKELAVGPYLKNKPQAALPLEQGWKDTIQVRPGEVTVLRARFAPIDGSGAYPFEPWIGPGYVWHCHILDHEDNEMMRPYRVLGTPTVMPIADRSVLLGSKQVIPVVASNPNMGMMMYTMQNAPADATMTKEGIIYWIPKAVGTYDFTVTVNDGFVAPISTGVRVTVSADAVQKAPIVEPIDLGLVLNQASISHQVKAYDPNGDALTFSLSNGPAGSAISGTGVFTWTPNSPGVFTFDVLVDDGTAISSRQVILTVVNGYDFVTRWNMEGASYLNSKNINNQYGSRAMAMMHTAIFDAVNSINPTYAAYHASVPAPATASDKAAVAAAAHTVWTTLYPADAARFDALFNSQIASLPNDQSRADGISVGVACANAIIQLRANDGSAQANIPYLDKMLPGEYRRTSMMNPLMPGWGSVTPWAMSSSSQFRLAGPPALDSAAYAAAFEQTKMLGARSSTMRTGQQSEDALFWIGGVPDHFYGIARELAGRYDLSLMEKARLFALLTIGMADASISGWDTKYHYTFWRPVTAIHDAELDGNPLTTENNQWMPFIMTPAFPEYASGHSTTCSAGATMLAQFFGSDAFTYVRTSSTPGLPAHEYTSISEIAQEAGASRIPAGVHFSFSNVEALTAGAQISQFAFANQLLPLV